MLSFGLYDDFDLPEVQEAYTLLEEQGDYLLNASYTWTKTWWETFRYQENLGCEKKMCIVRVLRDGVPCAMIALITYKKCIRKTIGTASFKILGICGDLWGATFEGFLGCLSVSETAELMDFIRHTISYDWLYFSHVPVDSPLRQVIAHQILLSACPTISLDAYSDYEHFVKETYSKKLRQNIRTGNNHAKKNGHNLTSKVVPFSEVDFDKLKSLSVSKLVSGKHSIYLDTDKEKFIKRLLEQCSGNVVMIECDGEPVAYRLNFFVGKKKYCFDASYDRDFDRYEVGIQSLDASLRESYEAERLWHCEGTGLDSYKLKFLKSAIPIYILTEPGNTMKGRLTFPIKLHRLRKQENIFKEELFNMQKKCSFTMLT